MVYYKVYEKSVLLKQGNMFLFELTDDFDVERQIIIKTLPDWQKRNCINVIIKNISVF
jgi:hypothetical protein